MGFWRGFSCGEFLIAMGVGVSQKVVGLWPLVYDGCLGGVR